MPNPETWLVLYVAGSFVNRAQVTFESCHNILSFFSSSVPTLILDHYSVRWFLSTTNYKVHIFWEGHKNMTKSPNFFWQNGLLSKFFSKFFDFLKKWAAADKPCPQLQPTLLRRPFCQKKFGDFVIFLWPSQNIWTLTIDFT